MGPLFVILLAKSFDLCQSVPTSYNQRQEGRLNVHANLENLMFVLGTSDSMGVLQLLAEETISTRGLMKNGPQTDLPATKYEVEDTQDESKEPYRVEIVRIERDEGKKSQKSAIQEESSERFDTEDKNALLEIGSEIQKATDKPVETSETEKKGKSLRRQTYGRVANDDKRQKGQVKDDQGGEREKGAKTRNVWTRVSDPSRPGQSLKKELSRKESEREKNDIGTSQSKPQELMLLGDGIENCGPGRFRDRAGICQVDESFN